MKQKWQARQCRVHEDLVDIKRVSSLVVSVGSPCKLFCRMRHSSNHTASSTSVGLAATSAENCSALASKSSA
eukprot:776917-Amorphochlora_amoeboformis.AAC.2